jgi:hypothetical protein
MSIREPDRTLFFEPAEVQALSWLPLAVRFKLDVCGLRLSLAQWQDIQLGKRAELVLQPLELGRFQDAAIKAGAQHVVSRGETRQGLFDLEKLRRAFHERGLSHMISRLNAYWPLASDYERYLLMKLLTMNSIGESHRRDAVAMLLDSPQPGIAAVRH